MPTVLMEGWLKKKAPPTKKMGITIQHAWETRYFILKRDRLWRYKSKPDLTDESPMSPTIASPILTNKKSSFFSKTPKHIDMNKAVVSALKDRQIIITDSAMNSHLLMAATDEEFNQWLTALKNVSAHNSVNLNDFELLMRVGEGGFGTVYKVRWHANDQVYAMKVINKTALNTEQDMEDVVHEVACMQALEHPFIVRLYCCFQNTEKLVLLMDFLGGGEVYTLLCKIKFPEEVVRILAAQLALALSYLHDHGIVHRDVKPENCVLNEHGSLILTDFGLSMETGKKRVPRAREYEAAGSKEYMAPELLEQGDVAASFASDWWAFGCVVFLIASRVHPFSSKDGTVDIHSVLSKPPILDVPGVSEELKDLVKHFLVPNPAQRLQKLEDIKAHAWFKGLDWEGVENETVGVSDFGEWWGQCVSHLKENDKFDAGAISRGTKLETSPCNICFDDFGWMRDEMAKEAEKHLPVTNSQASTSSMEGVTIQTKSVGKLTLPAKCQLKVDRPQSPPSAGSSSRASSDGGRNENVKKSP